MSWKSTVRAFEAARRRQESEVRALEREAQRQARTRERQFRSNLRRAKQEAREQAKLDALEQARSEVQAHEQEIALLVSLHKALNETIDWLDLASTFIPPPPERTSFQELMARQKAAILPPERDASGEDLIRRAWELDETEYTQAMKAYTQEESEWTGMKDLALGVLSKSPESYLKAIEVLAPFAEISDLGSSTKFVAHSEMLVECTLKVHGEDIIPDELKALTAAGKLASRMMPRSRFHELYQDHICSALLRIAREVFGLLQIEHLIVTAIADIMDPETEEIAENAVLSALIRRSDVEKLEFSTVDPSDAIDSLVHRGDFKAGRKAGAFKPIVPLTSADVVDSAAPTYEATLIKFKDARTAIQVELEQLVFDEVED